MYVGFIGDHFFLLSTDSTYSCVPGDQGGPIYLFYVQIGVLQFVLHVQFLRKIECNEFVCNKFVSNLVQIDLIQFENTNCIKSVCTKTITNVLLTNSLYSISHKKFDP